MPINYNIYLGIIIAFGLLLFATNIIWYSWNAREIAECNEFMVEREELYKKMYPLAGTVNIPVYNLTEILQWQ